MAEGKRGRPATSIRLCFYCGDRIERGRNADGTLERSNVYSTRRYCSAKHAALGRLGLVDPALELDPREMQAIVDRLVKNTREAVGLLHEYIAQHPELTETVIPIATQIHRDLAALVTKHALRDALVGKKLHGQ